jgi:ABC-type arginine/histidine transport system permease subunit
MYETTYHYDPLASTTSQIASSTTVLSTSTVPQIATTTDIVILPTYTAGEVLISLFLFCLILIQLLQMLLSALDRVQTKRKYLGYNGGDVEIRNDI